MIYLLLMVLLVVPALLLSCTRPKSEQPRVELSSSIPNSAPAAVQRKLSEGTALPSTTPSSAGPSIGPAAAAAPAARPPYVPPTQPPVRRLEGPELRAEVNKALEQMRKETGYYSTSARRIRERGNEQLKTPGSNKPKNLRQFRELNNKKAGTPSTKTAQGTLKSSKRRSPSFKEMGANRGDDRYDRTRTPGMELPEGLKQQGSMMTALSEYHFYADAYKHIGEVDKAIAEYSDRELLDFVMASNQSITCLDPTDPARSPFFNGQFSVWVADKVGSQAEEG